MNLDARKVCLYLAQFNLTSVIREWHFDKRHDLIHEKLSLESFLDSPVLIHDIVTLFKDNFLFSEVE